MAVVTRKCPLYFETYDNYKNNLKVMERLNEFLTLKRQDPTAKFGAVDKKYEPPFVDTRHAHLNHDISIAYRISGQNPHLLDLIGIFSHDESGTGQPPNHKIQKKLAKKISKQKFTIAESRVNSLSFVTKDFEDRKGRTGYVSFWWWRGTQKDGTIVAFRFAKGGDPKYFREILNTYKLESVTGPFATKTAAEK